MRGFALLLPLALLGTCSEPDEAPPAPGPSTPEAFAAQEAACLSRGGRFAPIRDGSSVKLCFIQPADANQSCSVASDCEGACLARSRTCSPVIPLIGCHEVMLDGQGTAEQCTQ